jgi:hypothetical protein
MYSNILARSAMRSAAARRIARSDLYHFENTNGQVMCKVDATWIDINPVSIRTFLSIPRTELVLQSRCPCTLVLVSLLPSLVNNWMIRVLYIYLPLIL